MFLVFEFLTRHVTIQKPKNIIHITMKARRHGHITKSVYNKKNQPQQKLPA
jgi:hypothetical protein